MYVSLCSVLPPENWSALLPNKGNSLLSYLVSVYVVNWCLEIGTYMLIKVLLSYCISFGIIQVHMINISKNWILLTGALSK